MSYITAWDLFVSRKSIHLPAKSPDTSRPFGALFEARSWFRPGQITEISGFPGLGLSKMLIDSIVTAAMPKCNMGLDLAVAVIDTDGNLSVERLYSELEPRVGRAQIDTLLGKIHLARVLDEHQFLDALATVPALDSRVLVIDSISFPIQQSNTHRFIRTLSGLLQTIASSGVIVLFSSHRPVAELGSICDNRILIYCDQGRRYARLLKPALGVEVVAGLDT